MDVCHHHYILPEDTDVMIGCHYRAVSDVVRVKTYLQI